VIQEKLLMNYDYCVMTPPDACQSGARSEVFMKRSGVGIAKEASTTSALVIAEANITDLRVEEEF